LAACQPTGVHVCDRNVDALVTASSKGGHFDCTPTEIELPAHKDGWYDGNGTMYIRPDPDATYVTWLMWHELGHHVLVTVAGGMSWQIPDATREWWADGYAWCHKPLAGFPYRNKPVDCAPYLG
jgi:hypothetical protein